MTIHTELMNETIEELKKEGHKDIHKEYTILLNGQIKIRIDVVALDGQKIAVECGFISQTRPSDWQEQLNNLGFEIRHKSYNTVTSVRRIKNELIERLDFLHNTDLNDSIEWLFNHCIHLERLITSNGMKLVDAKDKGTCSYFTALSTCKQMIDENTGLLKVVSCNGECLKCENQ